MFSPVKGSETLPKIWPIIKIPAQYYMRSIPVFYKLSLSRKSSKCGEALKHRDGWMKPPSNATGATWYGRSLRTACVNAPNVLVLNLCSFWANSTRTLNVYSNTGFSYIQYLTEASGLRNPSLYREIRRMIANNILWCCSTSLLQCELRKKRKKQAKLILLLGCCLLQY